MFTVRYTIKNSFKTGEVQQPDTGCVETYEVEVIDGDLLMSITYPGTVYLIGAGPAIQTY